jgi:hypothetical protein
MCEITRHTGGALSILANHNVEDMVESHVRRGEEQGGNLTKDGNDLELPDNLSCSSHSPCWECCHCLRGSWEL